MVAGKMGGELELKSGTSYKQLSLSLRTPIPSETAFNLSHSCMEMLSLFIYDYVRVYVCVYYSYVST